MNFTTARWYVNKGRNSTLKYDSYHNPFLLHVYQFSTVIPLRSAEAKRVVYVPIVRGSNFLTESGILISARSPKFFTGFCWFFSWRMVEWCLKVGHDHFLVCPSLPPLNQVFKNPWLFWHADIHSSGQETSRAISLRVVISSYVLIC